MAVTGMPATGGREVAAGDVARAWSVLAHVADPEIPVLSIVDLGIVRSVEFDGAGVLQVGVSPTYSGCPATDYIRGAVAAALREAGYTRVRVRDVLSPPWSSDWISEAGRRKLRDYGVAPPAGTVSSTKHLLHGDLPIACPRCASIDTEKLSEFGSTPCKALYRCRACLEPFDYFKCI
jgi:ring-1,2-phenylacetyl-CoA epoxidase subunit PaaD